MNKFVTLLPLLFLSCLPTKVNAQQFPPASVNVVAAKVTTLTPVVSVSGTVVSQNDSKIAAEISGRLVSLSPLGKRVKKGEVIAQIDDKRLLIQQKQDEANLLNSQTRLRFLQEEVTRKTALVKQKLTPATELDKAISDRDVAKGDVIAAQAVLAKTQQDLAYTQLKAPFTGIVAQRIANLGEFVNNGSAIVRLVETANMEASVFAPITSYQFLKSLKTLAVESPLGVGNAPIKTIVPVADTRSHLMEVRLDMSAFDWPIGLNIKAKVASGESKEALVVPRDALVLRRDGNSVFRIVTKDKSKDKSTGDVKTTEKVAEKVSVVVGMGVGGVVEITGNVKAGDLIVVRGAERLMAGQSVQIKDNNQSLVSSNHQ